MVSSIHFISGLPRSGSTLLCAVLKQNPRFLAAMTSPVNSLCTSLIPKMGVGTEFAAFFNDDRRRSVLRGVFDGYYEMATPDQVVFDTNRTWTGRAALIRDLYPQARIICCVRDIWWIIDSIEHMIQKNPLQVSRLFNFKPGSSIFARVETLMNPETGLIGIAWNLLREAWFGPNATMLIIVQYESLVQQPEKTIDCLYEQLGLPSFGHDFDQLDYSEPVYDSHLGLPGMHSVRPRLEAQRRQSLLPPEIPAKCADTSFWMKPETNRNNVVVI
jgi:sulfotransferase